MSKKTVSVLLLITFTLAVALFSFTSCNNFSVPTAAPRPGDIPEIPSDATTINRFGSDQEDYVSALLSALGDFFVDYADTYGAENSGEPLYVLMNSPEFSFDDATATLSADASSGTFRNKYYSHEAITGSIDVKVISENEKDPCIFADTTVKTDLFGWTDNKIHIEYDFIDEKLSVFIDKENYNTPDILFDLENDLYINVYKNGATTALDDGEERNACLDKLSFLMFLGYKAMADATISFSDVVLTDTMDENTDNYATFTINGQVQLSGTLKNVTDFDAKDDEMSDVLSSFSASAESLSIQASVVTEFNSKSEILAATLSIGNFSLSADLVDDGMTVSFDKVSLSFSDSGMNNILSLELSDFTFNLSVNNSHRMSFDTSFTLGLGLKAGDYSAGVFTDIEFTLGSLTHMPYLTFTPKAAVIDGSFYNTKDVKDLLIDYFDQLLYFLSSLSAS